MATAKLTKTFVGSLAPKASTFIVYDRELPGFGIRVTPAGARSWIVEYRPNGGGRRVATRRLTLGSLATLTSEKARNAARDHLARVRLGADPAKDLAKGRKAATVSELSAKFLRPEARPGRKASTVALYELYFRVHVLPEIGSKRAQDVTRSDVIRLHRKIGAAKPSTANRIVATLSGFFSWAAKEGEIDRSDNPAKDIDLFKEKARDRFLTSSELARLGDALREAETVGIPHEVDAGPKSKHARKPENRLSKIDPFASAAIRLLLLTGARLREILHLKWSNVDLERGLLFLDDSKTDKKAIVLNAPALLILSTLPRVGIYVVAGQSAGNEDETPRADLHRPWRAIVKRAKLEGLRIHDLRHTHASIGAGAGVGLPIIGRLLGHRQSETTARYAHLADDPLRKASERIGGDLARAMGEGVVSPSDVIAIARVSK